MRKATGLAIAASLIALAAATRGHHIANVRDFVVDPNVLKPRVDSRSVSPMSDSYKGGVLQLQDPGIALPGSNLEHIPGGEEPQTGPTLLRTQLAVTREVSIFASYVREFAQLELRFNDKDEFSIVLAPMDTAVGALTAKPWDFPNVVNGDNLSEQDKDALVRKNILSFVAHHVHLDTSSAERDDIVSSSDGTFELTNDNGDKLQVTRTSGNITIVKAGHNPEGDAYAEQVVTAHVVRSTPVGNGILWILDQSLAVPR